MKYLCDPHIIPAVVPREAAEITAASERLGVLAAWLHIDIADGTFSPDTNWPLGGFTELPTGGVSSEVHLMTAEPEELGVLFAKAGAKRIVAHREAFSSAEDARRALDNWRTAGAEAGLALLIDTPLATLDGVIDACDFVQLMSIAQVGHQGETFDERALSRVEEFHAKYPDTMAAVDGGISEATVEELVRAGANRLIVGSALSDSAQPDATYASIHARAMRGCGPYAQSSVVG